MKSWRADWLTFVEKLSDSGPPQPHPTTIISNEASTILHPHAAPLSKMVCAIARGFPTNIYACL